MDLQALKETPSWEWPSSAGEIIRSALRDSNTSSRQLAVELAGDLVVMNDEMAAELLAIVRSSEEAAEVRERAAIAFGPILETVDIDGFVADGDSAPPLAEATFNAIQQTLRALYLDTSAPKLARRRALEASVRAAQAWHTGAIREAWSSGDDEWRTTAVFAMQYVPGFDREILKALADANPEIRFEAVRAAGARGIASSWPRIKTILTGPADDRDLLLAAIEAAPLVNAEKARPLLTELADSADAEIADAAEDALSMSSEDEI